mmetsp:Transcript_42260/g.82964  ORF Transcript_42260/g.82964 Transcript_42260/m.82964 type:complete len:168 (+) Transcript_42260:27-530(+)|eukprot:CAMPEP_0175141298 /NCGR_PEP_ID=MMETSP0087-20121206/12030_1 /TAXON_ID=136419 /ORGANISM="Unknown Unknown, Strain D1" /LENGTH=167 /DNA_ID=CAMNT_0016424703 /DNA_START=27 /DNA_END=530 /DNA_ORIENTATION=-
MINVFQQFDENVGTSQVTKRGTGLKSRRALGDITNKGSKSGLSQGKFGSNSKNSVQSGSAKGLKDKTGVLVKPNKTFADDNSFVPEMEFCYGSSESSAFDGGLDMGSIKKALKSKNFSTKSENVENMRFEPFGLSSLDDKLGEFNTVGSDFNLDNLDFDCDGLSDSD